ncbi:pimeloyl-ACP methyl ester carboxylesterase [Pseudoclavibacter sp. JAI123]|uniref:alpha/beta fold hydrolase n=1 Tax=Pseudoclavibacter sp. JAI123 TaxID=2723065 RepID=UPI0015CB367F|nr:alpha/beta hydrolase [Pseudoclavibacter sp. JAI123]NYF11993.1 pimeloyl-ACP methyl ester carboxylesterase [Pseudoclavibacter sp. JAI123]
MDIILIPGFWLTGDSWAPVTRALEAAGHTAHPLTLPGKGAGESPAGIGLRTHIDAVTALIDSLDGEVVVIGHSGGGAIAYGAVDARPDRVAKVVYVDSGPLADGGVINDALPVKGDSIPLPDPSVFEAAELDGLDGDRWQLLADIAVPEPLGVATEQQRLSDERRYDVPAVVITSTMPEPLLRQFMEGGHPYVAELARARDVQIVELPTGHWPQLTKPDELAAAVVDAVTR